MEFLMREGRRRCHFKDFKVVIKHCIFVEKPHQRHVVHPSRVEMFKRIIVKTTRELTEQRPSVRSRYDSSK